MYPQPHIPIATVDDAKKAHENNLVKIMVDTRTDNTFIIGVLMHLKLVWTHGVPTAGTDGLKLYINPDFYMSLSTEEQIFLILHETWHVAFTHMLRLGDKNMKRWNMACDYVINAMLVGLGYTMPKGGLYDRNYFNQTADYVYTQLKADPVSDDEKNFIEDVMEPQDDSDVVDSTGGNSSSDSTDGQPKPSDAGAQSTRDIQTKIEDIVIQAALRAESLKAAGNLPSEIKKMLSKLLNPVVPWHTVLKRHLKAQAKTKNSWKKLKRRYQPKFILPTKSSKGLEHIAVAVDASCSVSDHEFSHFLVEIDSIRRQYRPQKMTLLEFSTEIKREIVLNQRDCVFDVEFDASGGTDVMPVIQWANEHQPNALIVLSDGYFCLDDTDYPEHLYWVIHNYPEFCALTGTIVHYTLTEPTKE